MSTPTTSRRAENQTRQQEIHIDDASRSPDIGVETDRGPTAMYPGIPRWVKVIGIVVLALALLFGVSHFTGLDGLHGGGMHMPKHQP
jgi:hypothetical protein